jgi:hypothetical protein
MAHLPWPDFLGPGQQFQAKTKIIFIMYLCIIIFENNNIPKIRDYYFWLSVRVQVQPYQAGPHFSSSVLVRYIP